MNFVHERAARLGKMEAWYCVYRLASLDCPVPYSRVHTDLIEPWRNEPPYKLERDDSGRVLRVETIGMDPIVRNAIPRFENVRDHIWDLCIKRKELRADYLKTNLPLYDREIFLDNMRLYDQGPETWKPQYYPHCSRGIAADRLLVFSPVTSSSSSDMSDSPTSTTFSPKRTEFNRPDMEIDDEGEPINRLFKSLASYLVTLLYLRWLLRQLGDKRLDGHSSVGIPSLEDPPSIPRSTIPLPSSASSLHRHIIEMNDKNMQPGVETSTMPQPVPLLLLNDQPVFLDEPVSSLLFAMPNGCQDVPGLAHYHTFGGEHLPDDRYLRTHPQFRFPHIPNVLPTQEPFPNRPDLITFEPEDLPNVLGKLLSSRNPRPPISNLITAQDASSASMLDVSKASPFSPRPIKPNFQYLRVPGSPSSNLARPPTPIVTTMPFVQPVEITVASAQPIYDHPTDLEFRSPSPQPIVVPRSASSNFSTTNTTSPATQPPASETGNVLPSPAPPYKDIDAKEDTGTSTSTSTCYPTSNSSSLSTYHQSIPRSVNSSASYYSVNTGRSPNRRSNASEDRKFFLIVASMTLSWLTTLIFIYSSTILAFKRYNA